MSSLIIPAAGKSTRFPNMKPKWLLTHPIKNIMLDAGMSGLDFKKFNNIYISLLKEHIVKYDCEMGLIKIFDEIGILDKIHFVFLDKTNSQPETVYKTINKKNIKGHIFVKDVDDYFETDILKVNAVCSFNLKNMTSVNPGNKSYITTNDSGLIENIIEKRIISENFCCGGYSFENAELFSKYFEKISSNIDNNNLYISHIIYSMLLDGIPFIPIEVKNYYDWGTLEDWNKYKSQFKTIFIDLDGILVENSSEFFKPLWGTTNGIKDNIQYLRDLYNTNKVKLIITTSRKKEYKDITISQLNKENIPYDDIIFDLPHSKRIIINDYANSNIFPSCEAININRNSDKLKEVLR